ncbi:uncharacterized protein EV420DRAFT_539382 [Desarmillaria tabescens]|uniref:Uncharacterized protein n=1 Tax=Armillaria tabescens TaxID=1929756 RepID=A0AA39KBU2_ARMTA|nr:uncharacterized protein EV420DRAFT_539382 [Desarmillaria tabescens]KAK0457095.1 hypothetical protein EV420DRAFT_539382 [Desarmillaria tabescens]
MSPSFRIRAQYHLFRHVDVYPPTGFARFNELCKISPLIPRLIRSLRTTTWHKEISDPEKLQLHILINLEKISLSEYDSTSIPPWDNASAIDSQISYSATSMNLDCIHFPSTQNFRSCIESFPALKTLSIRGLLIHDAKSIEHVSSNPGPPIETLTIKSSGMKNNHERVFIGSRTEKIGWQKPFGLSALRKLRMVFCGLRLVPKVQNILDITHNTIQEFYLLLTPEARYDQMPVKGQHVLIFSRVPFVTFDPTTSDTSWEMRYLVTCLRKGVPTRLNVSLDYSEDTFHQLHVEGTWMALDNVMRDGGSLLCVTIEFDGDIDREAIKRKFALRLPRMYAAGRLAVVFTDDHSIPL